MKPRPSLLRTAALGLALLLGLPAAAQIPPPGGPPAGPPPAPGPGVPPLPPVDHSFDDLKPPANGVAFFGLAYGISKPLPPDAPQPSSDPHNLEGAWTHTESIVFLIDHDVNDMRPPYNPRAHKLLRKRLQSIADSKPFLNAAAECRPPGLLWQLDMNPFLIFQSKDRIDVLYQEYHGLQTIYMNPADAPRTPSYMGTSIGHWEGDTLVVVTKGMKQPIWLDVDGTPASANAIITERIRKVNDGRPSLRFEITLDDPAYYTHPWTWVRDFAWRPDDQVLSEYDCETEVGDKTGNSAAGLVPEPADDDKP